MNYNFRKTFKVIDKNAIQWFPGHMGKGLRQMQQKLKLVDCVIEVHDARIPFSGRNTDFKHTVTGLKPHILVLNKKDLGIEKSYDKIAEQIKKEEGIDHVLFTNCKDHQCTGTRRVLPLARDLIMSSNRYNRTNLPEYCLMIIGVPNVGKSSLTNVMRNRHLKMKGASAVGAVAGITRSVLNRIKVSEKPLIYLLDTPGILAPRIGDTDQGMKLASVSCFQDHLVGEMLIADYILFWLNKNDNFAYVPYMGLEKPSDDVGEVLLAACGLLNKTIKVKQFDGKMIVRPNFEEGAKHLIKGFRTGTFGKINLDNNLVR